MRQPICTDQTATLLKRAAIRYVNVSDGLYDDGHRDLAECVAKAAKLLADAGCTLEVRLGAARPARDGS